MSHEFALLPEPQIKKPNFLSSIFSKKEAKKTENNGLPDSATQRRKQKVGIDYVSYFQVRSEKNGFAYYENNSKTPAFTASRNKVVVHKLDDNAIRAGLQLANASFGVIRVEGPADVRRQVWLQGQAIGIDVAGYEPNEKDQAAADKLRPSPAGTHATAQISAAREATISASPVAPVFVPEPKEELVTQPRQPDVLVEHGSAPFEFKEDNKLSYYVTVQEASGDHKVYWGVDLERAIGEAGAEVGDQVSLERLGRDKVKVLDQKTNLFREVDRQTWRVDVLEKTSTVARQDVQINHENTTKRHDSTISVFSGYLNYAGKRIEVDFEAPTDASDAVKDSAFLSVLAQQADINVNYLSIGETALTVSVFSGYLNYAGKRIEVEFEAPTDASDAVKDSAFLSVLAQQADINVNYLSIGETGLPAINRRLGVEAVVARQDTQINQAKTTNKSVNNAAKALVGEEGMQDLKAVAESGQEADQDYEAE